MLASAVRLRRVVAVYETSKDDDLKGTPKTCTSEQPSTSPDRQFTPVPRHNQGKGSSARSQLGVKCCKWAEAWLLCLKGQVQYPRGQCAGTWGTSLENELVEPRTPVGSTPNSTSRSVRSRSKRTEIRVAWPEYELARLNTPGQVRKRWKKSEMEPGIGVYPARRPGSLLSYYRMMGNLADRHDAGQHGPFTAKQPWI